MASAKVVTMDGKELDPVELNDAVFGQKLNASLVHEVVVALQNARRQGNASTKTRREVRGGGAKPFRQKGTGNARQGTSRAPQMRGGGAVFGPHKRSYRQKVTVRSKRQALLCVLSERVREGALCVLDQLTLEAPKTKPFAEMLERVVPGDRSTLLVTAAVDRTTMLSSRNLQKVAVKTATDINALDVLNAVRLVVTRDALEKLEERLA